MFTVNSTNKNASFWARNKPFIDNLFKAGAFIVGLKVLKVVCDKVSE